MFSCERVTHSMNTSLLRPFTREEIYTALSQMHPTKVPGSDGMSALFFQKYWHIVGDQVTAAILDCLNGGSFLSKINFTHIVLIPKTQCPEDMAHFRPISLCNVVYKIVAKVLANRLKIVLPHVISESQSAFVPERLITDNVLVSYELNHYLKWKNWGKTGFVSLKLDMSKAYDRMECEYLK
uniref:Reverse transcriptase domain-containing protein n=1 Tax=Davidia involucrata TaxID=16924 RepID=A0A5B7BZB7_DAVIN